MNVRLMALRVVLGMVPISAASIALSGEAPARFEKGYLDVGGGTKAWLPNLARTRDGSILCAYTEGVAPKLDSIQVVRTRDAGETWGGPVRALGVPGPGYIADPNILVASERATVFATFVPETTPRYARSETWAATSEDGGKSWGKPSRVAMPHKYTSGKVHVPLSLADGTIVMGYSWDIPAEQGRPVDSEPRMLPRAGVLRSEDRGHTWKPGGDVPGEVPGGTDEPALVSLKDGSLFMIVRTGDRNPYETRSRDGGLSWDPPRPSRFEGYNAPSALLRLQDDSILRAWDHSPTNRHPLCVSLSTDECRTWSTPRVVTEPKAGGPGRPPFRTACYPSLAQADDGTILLVWWETGDFGSRIGRARFNRAWLDLGPAERPVTR